MGNKPDTPNKILNIAKSGLLTISGHTNSKIFIENSLDIAIFYVENGIKGIYEIMYKPMIENDTLNCYTENPDNIVFNFVPFKDIECDCPSIKEITNNITNNIIKEITTLNVNYISNPIEYIMHIISFCMESVIIFLIIIMMFGFLLFLIFKLIRNIKFKNNNFRIEEEDLIEKKDKEKKQNIELIESFN